jgi:glycyl-tRNA synthetase beta subunit
MLTNRDITKLIEAFKAVFPTREEAALKSDLDEVKNDVSNLRTVVDNYAKEVRVYRDEVIVMNHRITKLENLLN